MTNIFFLIFIPDFFDVEGTIIALFNESGKKIADVLPGEDFTGSVVAYDVTTLVDEYRKAVKHLPCELIDLGEGLRLVQGQARDDGGESGWNPYKALRACGTDKARLKQFEQLARGRVARPASSEIDAILIAAAKALVSAWEILKQKLIERGEKERFFTVEVPFQQFCWYRQWSGINIDKAIANEFLASCRSEKYEAYLSIAEQVQISPSGLSYRTVKNILPQTDAAHLLSVNDEKDLENEFKIAAKTSVFADSFMRFMRSSRDEGILARLSGVDTKVYPIFQPLGTVTGRCLVSDPYLQNIRRKYRAALSADEGKVLVYLDYSQFEPGICAFLSGDEKFIEHYNAGDIYSNLSKVIFLSEEFRDRAKRIFLSYLYGMSLENMGKLLSPKGNATESKKHIDAISNFFSAYPRLEKFRSDSAAELKESGKIGTLLGNYRHRKLKGDLTSKERRWAANQRVQGTASLILKEATIALVKKFGVDAFVIPVHDAVLLQVDASVKDQAMADAIRIMEEALNSRCPSILARVKAGSFEN